MFCDVFPPSKERLTEDYSFLQSGGGSISSKVQQAPASLHGSTESPMKQINSGVSLSEGLQMREQRVQLLLLLLGGGVCWVVHAQVRHPLPVLWTMGSAGGNLTGSVAPAVRLALQDLERQAPPLGEYELQLHPLHPQCDPAASLKALFDALWGGPQFLLLLGGVSCPSVTGIIARSLPALHLLQVSFSAPPPSLSNRKWWSRVGLLTQEGAKHSVMKKDLERQLLKADVHVVSSESFSADACSSLRTIRERDARIIIALLHQDSAPEVFCCAYRLNMFGARYQWLLLADGAAAGWSWVGRRSGCSADSLQTAADGAMRLQRRVLSSSGAPGVSGRTPQQYLRLLTEEGSKVDPLHGYAYDAVWVAARALTQVMEAVKLREKYGSQRNTSGEELQRKLLDALKHTHFQGVTGPVFFRNGERMASIELLQFQGSGGVLVGDFNTSTQQLRLMNHLLKFKGPAAARDRTLVLEQCLHVGLLMFGLVSSAAALTTILTLTALLFTLIHRTHQRRGLCAGCLEELLLLGLLLSSSSVLISGLDGPSLSHQVFETLCSVRLWTLSVGHTVVLAVLFIRSWGVYSLRSIKPPVNHKAPAPPPVSVTVRLTLSVFQQQHRRRRSLCVLLWFLLMDALLLTTWQVLDPLRRVVLQHGDQSVSAEEDVVIRPFSETCSSGNMELWITVLCGYKAPLMGLGCFMAWSIRRVEDDPRAASRRRLTLSMLALMLLSVAGAAASLLTSHNPPLHFCLRSTLILCCNICILSLMFAPRLRLWKLCLRNSEQQRPTETQIEAAEEEEEEEEEDKEEDKKLLISLNQQLKSHTAQLDAEIETLTLQLCELAPQPRLHHAPPARNNGKARCVRWTHAAQVCSEDRNSGGKPSSLDSINAPEHVQRRVSVQLPILHLSYMPAVGGVSASSSSLFPQRDDHFLFT
ncbi:hypothetical protein PBY51_017104 [Eleginops maclovinus]|uniref:G-protein coupled receptors family 3 profile domain-containing protein n=1 Tax=Eleginops maclovinus TaxID=56733 RepID=A0AAN7XJ34_ELEMC|nr:hypothetical protein PBY51_017104 [Eleginops maclovinus]